MEPEYEVDSLKTVNRPDLKESVEMWSDMVRDEIHKLPETDLQRSFRKMALNYIDDESISDKDFRQLFRNAKQIGAI